MDIKKILEQFIGKKIIVIGDLMIDHYLKGNTERISPEAPIPVVEISDEEYRLGGAANVVYNLKNLGAEPLFLSATGDDQLAQKIRSILMINNIATDLLLTDKSRRTTIKTRVIAQNQQMVRIDIEDKHFINREIENKIIDNLKSQISQTDAIILEDYNKGILTESLIESIVEIAKENNIPVAVDPKFMNFTAYKNVDIFKPNLKEMERGTGMSIQSEDQLLIAAQNLIAEMNMKYLVITRGKNGLFILDQHDNIFNIPTYAQQVYDVSGAGDTVIAVLTLAFASGLSIEKAADIANHAAGAVCAKAGIAPVSANDIIKSFREYNE